MKKSIARALMILLVLVLIQVNVLALSPSILLPIMRDWSESCEKTDTTETLESLDLLNQYSDADVNMIANVVNGEVGGICGTVVLTYADGSQLWTDGSTLRMIHARIVDNQVNSSIFPATVYECVGQCWSWNYTGTGWRESTQWQSCRQAVLDALAGDIYVPDNVFAATCDPNFASYYSGWYLWARVDWDTGWCSGTFYYYKFN